MLPGGRVVMHWLMPHPEGPIVRAPAVKMSNRGPRQITKGIRGRIACRPALASDLPSGTPEHMALLFRSEEPRAVDCPACMATPEYRAAMAALEKPAVPTGGV